MLRLYPLKSLFDESIADVKAATDLLTSAAYIRRDHAVPWTVDPVTFVLETDTLNVPHIVKVNDEVVATVIPENRTTSIALTFEKGDNTIEVTHGTARYSAGVAATKIETWMRAVGREKYLAVDRRLDEIDAHFRSPWATRLSAHFLPYATLFMPARAPKIQQTKLAIAAIMGGRLGHEDGVATIASAVSYNTPFVVKPRSFERALPGHFFQYPGVSSAPTTAEMDHRAMLLWFPNQCYASSHALVRLALSLGAKDAAQPPPMSLVYFDDFQVVLRSNGGEPEVHEIDPTNPGCGEVDQAIQCDDRLRAFITMDASIEMVMTSPQLSLDEVVEEPLNFGVFDAGFAWDGADSGEDGIGGDPFLDSSDPDDPFGDGFVGQSLSQRLDGDGCWDTRVSPGLRVSKFSAPLDGSGMGPVTPVGAPLIVDAKAGAPTPSASALTFWATCPDTFIYPGDWLRTLSQVGERQIVSAWPAFKSTDFILKTTAAAIDASGVGYTDIMVAPGFFEPQHVGMGLRVGASTYYTIASVTEDGEVATLVGNGTALPGGSFVAAIYEPVRDREIDLPFLGRVVFEITLATGGLPFALTDQEVVDWVRAPLVNLAITMGDDVVSIMSDVVPRPGDLLYFSPSSSLVIEEVIQTSVHFTLRYPIYQLTLSGGAPANFAVDDPLYTIRADNCTMTGPPVTQLTIINITAGTYVLAG